jgi:hypothetical protein
MTSEYSTPPLPANIESDKVSRKVYDGTETVSEHSSSASPAIIESHKFHAFACQGNISAEKHMPPMTRDFVTLEDHTEPMYVFDGMGGRHTIIALHTIMPQTGLAFGMPNIRTIAPHVPEVVAIGVVTAGELIEIRKTLGEAVKARIIAYKKYCEAFVAREKIVFKMFETIRAKHEGSLDADRERIRSSRMKPRDEWLKLSYKEKREYNKETTCMLDPLFQKEARNTETEMGTVITQMRDDGFDIAKYTRYHNFCKFYDEMVREVAMTGKMVQPNCFDVICDEDIDMLRMMSFVCTITDETTEEVDEHDHDNDSSSDGSSCDMCRSRVIKVLTVSLPA